MLFYHLNMRKTLKKNCLFSYIVKIFSNSSNLALNFCIHFWWHLQVLMKFASTYRAIPFAVFCRRLAPATRRGWRPPCYCCRPFPSHCNNATTTTISGGQSDTSQRGYHVQRPKITCRTLSPQYTAPWCFLKMEIFPVMKSMHWWEI